MLSLVENCKRMLFLKRVSFLLGLLAFLCIDRFIHSFIFPFRFYFISTFYISPFHHTRFTDTRVSIVVNNQIIIVDNFQMQERLLNMSKIFVKYSMTSTLVHTIERWSLLTVGALSNTPLSHLLSILQSIQLFIHISIPSSPSNPSTHPSNRGFASTRDGSHERKHNNRV